MAKATLLLVVAGAAALPPPLQDARKVRPQSLARTDHFSCGHSSKDFPPPIPAPQRYAAHPWDHSAPEPAARFVGLGTPQPMRMHVDISGLTSDPKRCTSAGQQVTEWASNTPYTCTADDVLSAEDLAVLTDIILPLAEQAWEALLAVVPVDGSLKVKPFCPWQIDGVSCCETHAQCTYEDTNECAGLAIPSGHEAAGVPSTDVIMYATVAKYASTAVATTCRTDQHGRPVVGAINFNPSQFKTSTAPFRDDARKMQGYAHIAMHEMAHALGFSGSFFSKFRKPDGSAHDSPVLVTETSSALGKDVTYLATPAVKREARAHFGCDTLPGAEIEDSGGSGSAGSHFEERVYGNELMTPFSTGTTDRVSRLTLAALEDSGHYEVDYAAADRLLFGEGLGCTLANDKCNSWPAAASEHGFFCATDQDSACAADGEAAGYCSHRTYGSALPTNAQYFGDPAVGGSNVYADYCPRFDAYSNRYCDDTSQAGSSQRGIVYGSGSQCFMSSLHSFATVSRGGACMQASCAADGTLSITVGGETKACPPAGGGELTFTDFTGSVTCPPASLRCSGNQSPAPSASPTNPTAAPTMAPTAPTAAPTTGPTSLCEDEPLGGLVQCADWTDVRLSGMDTCAEAQQAGVCGSQNAQFHHRCPVTCGIPEIRAQGTCDDETRPAGGGAVPEIPLRCSDLDASHCADAQIGVIVSRACPLLCNLAAADAADDIADGALVTCQDVASLAEHVNNLNSCAEAASFCGPQNAFLYPLCPVTCDELVLTLRGDCESDGETDAGCAALASDDGCSQTIVRRLCPATCGVGADPSCFAPVGPTCSGLCRRGQRRLIRA